MVRHGSNPDPVGCRGGGRDVDGFRVLWFMVFGCIVLWFCGLWFYSFIVVWCYGFAFYGFVVLCVYGFMAL